MEKILINQTNRRVEQLLCFDCHDGFMMKIIYPESFDYNKDGYVPRSCEHCGTCSDQEKILEIKGTDRTNKISMRHAKKFTKIVCVQSSIDYKTRDKILDYFKDILDSIDCNDSYIFISKFKQITNKFGYNLKFDYLLSVHYKLFDKYFDNT